MPVEKKLSEVQPHYPEWIRDAKGGKFRGVPINTMSADDMLAVIGELNHICHDLQDQITALKGVTKSNILLPPGFKPKDNRRN